MKKILFILIFTTLNTFSQKKTLEIKLEEKSKIISYNFNESGGLSIHSGRQASPVTLIFKDQKLHKYDENLELVFNNSFEIEKNYPSGNYSPNGDYFFYNNTFIDKDGKIKTNYPASTYGAFKAIKKKSNLNPIFNFFSNYAYSFIGPKSGRSNIKKNYLEGDIFIYNFKNEDFTEETFPLVVQKIENNIEQKDIKWQLKPYFKDFFLLTTKDKLEKNSHTDISHFVKYNFNGSIKKYTKINLTLDDDKYFLISDNNGIKNSEPVAYTLKGSASQSGFHINEEDNSFLLYGYYSNKDGVQKRVGKVDGIYFFKFDENGKEIWKNYYPFSETKEGYLIQRKIEYIQSGEKGVILSYLNDENAMYLVNSETGKIETTSASLVNFFEKENKIGKDGFIELKLFKSYFWRNFTDKKTNKNYIDYNILGAILLKPEIEQFILDQTSKSKFINTYDAHFNLNGDIYITECKKGNEKFRGRIPTLKSINVYKF